jgi:hypothetical protein
MNNREAFDTPNDAYAWAHDSLLRGWGMEYDELSIEDQVKIITDLLDSDRTMAEIQADIFTGNLALYARSLA